MTPSTHNLIQQALAQARAGHKSAARNAIQRAAHLQPADATIWLCLVGLADNGQEARLALEQARALQPDHPQLAQAQAWLDQTWPADTGQRPIAPQPGLAGPTPSPSFRRSALERQAGDAPRPRMDYNSAPLEQPHHNPNLQSPNLPISLEAAWPIPGRLRRLWQLAWHAISGWRAIHRWRAIWPHGAAGPFDLGWGVTLMPAIGLVAGLGLMMIGFNFFYFSEALATGPLSSLLAESTSTGKLARLEQALEQARAANDRTAMIEALTRMRALAPADPDITRQLARQYYEQGLAWRDAGRLEAAGQSFGWALRVIPDFAEAARERQLAELYLAGMEHYHQAEWAKAVAAFKLVYDLAPAYLHVDEILYSAYFNLGVAQQAAGGLLSALESYQQADKILPGLPGTKQRLEAVEAKLNPAPLVTPPEMVIEKRIIVDISEQRAYVYENDSLIHKFIISTGEPGRDTAIGEFEIQSKIPMAYASTWNLDMPYWLGIYWAGPLENGFHAVPTVRHTGQTMWDGYLGQRVSYGCVILSMDDAKTLYDWAEMGVPVKIRP